MPTYVYECSSCNAQFEVQQRIIEDPLDTCPCGSKGTVKRVIQPIAVMFKGSGFHINDYAASTDSKKKSEEGTESKTEAKAETSTAATTDTTAKPAESPASAPAPAKET